MAKILVLPEHIASQIAAGEVVERPSSVVKELVENAIDAGASKISISISEGCRSIRVADNGCGMEPEDAVLAFQRHATSKLSTADQLWSLSTLGFRGEALPSIAAISRLTCYTRTASNTTGTKIDCADGELKASEVGCAVGTVFEVSDLFYNVPARLKFLKKASTEFGHIHEIVQSLAITYPSISFELFNDDELRLSTTGSGDFTQAIVESGHFSERETILDIAANENDLGLALTARVARPTEFRGDRKGIITIVNQRPVRCQITFKALDYAYSDLIPRGRYPIAVLNLTVKPQDIDINIHPTKKEIKYSNGNDIYSFIQRQLIRALRQPLGGNDSVQDRISPKHIIDSPIWRRDNLDHSWRKDTKVPAHVSPAPAPAVSAPKVDWQQKTFNSNLVYQPVSSSSFVREDSVGYTEDKETILALPTDWRLAGYLHNTYILLETAQGLLIVEQHIAHERTLYEKLLAEQREASKQPEHLQQLIVSCPLKLTSEQVACLEEHLSDLNALGFDFEKEDGKAGFACTQVPAWLAHKDYPKVIQEIIQALCESTNPDIKLEVTKSVACQSAIKNGMVLSESQILKLLSDWYNTPRNETCPHGRPIKLSFSSRQLFDLFHPQ